MNKDIQLVGFTPTKKQQEIIDICLQEDVKYVIANCGRQVGKSFLGMNIILKWVLEDNSSVGMWVAPIYQQSKKVFQELSNSLQGTGVTKSINKSELTITFINGSILYFRSAEREDGLRGNSLTYLVIDEAAFIKNNVWSEVLRATTLVKGKKVLFLSTPKGKNWFYAMAMRGLSDDYPQYRTVIASSYDSPYISEDELLEAKQSLPENIFRQEILAEFLDDGGEVFSNLKLTAVMSAYALQVSGEKYYAGLDFGRQNDYTVLTIFNSKGEMVDFYRERQKSWDVILSEVISKLRKWKPVGYAEINSIGDVLYDNLKKQYSAIQPFLTTNDTKQNMIEDLIMGMNEGKIKLPSQTLSADLYQEFSVFTYEYSPRTRKVKYGSPNGFHDDIVISVALAFQALKKKATYGTYVVR